MKVLVLAMSGLTLAFVIFISSCLDELPDFSHNQHVQKQSLDCDTCHAGSEDGIKAGVPSPDVCVPCHEEAKDATKLELIRKLTKEWPPLRILPPDGIFSHKQHKDAKIACENCHDGIAKSKKVTQKYLPAEKTCLKCHREKGTKTDCETCHKEINRNTAPPDHRQAWKQVHGEAAHDPIRGERCYRCHVRSTCDTCHQTEKPLDHGANWIEMGHGVESRIDRSKCQTCHKSDYCVRCHRESVPRSHNASYYPPSSMHCYDCHLGGANSQNCYVCHRSNIRHADAPSRPAGLPHRVATDCRSCHKSGGWLLKHPDNGENCLSCHK